MFVIILFVASVSIAGNVAVGEYNTGGGVVSNSIGNGHGFGYAGTGGYSAVPQFPQFDFNSAFGNYFNSFQKFHEQLLNNRNNYYSYAVTSLNPNANAQAQSFLTYLDNNGGGNHQGIQQQQQHIQTIPTAYFGAANNPTPLSDSNVYGGGASAGAAISPSGGYQSAAVYPQNPLSPNIETRFGAEGTEQQASGGGGGPNYGVFTSSISSSSNVNGKPTNFHKATTTINDNGKIKTYTVQNP